MQRLRSGDNIALHSGAKVIDPDGQMTDRDKAVLSSELDVMSDEMAKIKDALKVRVMYVCVYVCIYDDMAKIKDALEVWVMYVCLYVCMYIR